MTQPQPPQFPVAPFNPTPVQQNVIMDAFRAPDGQKVVRLMIIQPLTTTVLLLNEESARQLADQLTQHASGLQVVRDMPPNGASG